VLAAGALARPRPRVGSFWNGEQYDSRDHRYTRGRCCVDVGWCCVGTNEQPFGPDRRRGTILRSRHAGRACAAAAELPTFELMGFPITRHQVALLGAAQIRERSPTPTLTLADMPASPHQMAVLTPHPRPTEEPATNETVSFSTR